MRFLASKKKFRPTHIWTMSKVSIIFALFPYIRSLDKELENEGPPGQKRQKGSYQYVLIYCLYAPIFVSTPHPLPSGYNMLCVCPPLQIYVRLPKYSPPPSLLFLQQSGVHFLRIKIMFKGIKFNTVLSIFSEVNQFLKL